jgi:hypothetical protein
MAEYRAQASHDSAAVPRSVEGYEDLPDRACASSFRRLAALFGP